MFEKGKVKPFKNVWPSNICACFEFRDSYFGFQTNESLLSLCRDPDVLQPHVPGNAGDVELILPRDADAPDLFVPVGHPQIAKVESGQGVMPGVAGIGLAV